MSGQEEEKKQVRVAKPRLILCDIEGTTTAITFVKDRLFPYVRQNVRSYLKATWAASETKADIALLWEQYLVDQASAAAIDLPSSISDFSDTSLTNSELIDKSLDSIVRYILWQMDYDKKTTSLKQLQGHIWIDGYQNGSIKAHVYDEVPASFEEWTSNGIELAIYSSGSVLAQKLLFGYTSYGDLTKYLSHYFDTKVGAKQETTSYKAISDTLNVPACDILFLTDIVGEARAAISAGMQCLVLTRETATLSDEERRELRSVDHFNQILFD